MKSDWVLLWESGNHSDVPTDYLSYDWCQSDGSCLGADGEFAPRVDLNLTANGLWTELTIRSSLMGAPGHPEFVNKVGRNTSVPQNVIAQLVLESNVRVTACFHPVL